MPRAPPGNGRRRAGPGGGRRRRPLPWRLRRAGPSDLATLVRHRRRMWQELRDFSRTELDRHDRVYRQWVRGLLARGRFVGFVAEAPGGQPVGSGGVWRMPAQPRPGPLGRQEIPYILSMFTEPEYRGQGIASRIVQEMLRWARSRRYGRVVLHASRFGRPVYARLGFVDGSEMRFDLIPPTPPARPTAARDRRAGRRRPLVGVRSGSSRGSTR